MAPSTVSGVEAVQMAHGAKNILIPKKNDGTWRLPIDYCYLNAMTAIAKYLVMIM